MKRTFENYMCEEILDVDILRTKLLFRQNNTSYELF